MQRLFCGEMSGDGRFVIGEKEARHLFTVLRMQPGDMITVTSSDGNDHLCRIVKASSACIEASVVSSSANLNESPVGIIIVQGMPKGEKSDVIVQKAVELGAAGVIFTVTERSVSRPDDRTAERKTERLGRISASAAAQCGRAYVPPVRFLRTLEECVALAETEGTGIFCYELGGESLHSVFASVRSSAGTEEKKIFAFIGPEGGFSEKEAALFASHGFPACTLGKRILRTETAGAHLLSCAYYEFED